MNPSLGVNSCKQVSRFLATNLNTTFFLRTFISCVPCTVMSRDTPTTMHSAAMQYMNGRTVLAVSMGDQAGRRCCMKAELSGLRARGPGLASSLPMRGGSRGGPRGGRGGGGGSQSQQDKLLSTSRSVFRQRCLTHYYYSGLCQEIFPAGLAL